MRQSFFNYLPPELVIDIFARLPILSILTCKFVCKTWLDLLESTEFSELQFPNSVPGMAVFQGEDYAKPYQVFEFEEDLRTRRLERLCDLTFEFDFPHHAYIYSTVRGLIFMYDQDCSTPSNFFVCNPLTREYVTVPPPTECVLHDHTFGFGVSMITNQYKLIKIFRFPNDPSPSACEVYTLGTRSWRSIGAPGGPFKYEARPGAFLNGNLHWLAYDSGENPHISCFDVETEGFTTIACPANRPFDNEYFCCFGALQDCLCICDNLENTIDVWVMKEYGVQKSWSKEFVINIPPFVRLELEKFGGYRFPVKIFEEDKDVLIAEEDSPEIFCFSKRDNSLQESPQPEEFGCRTTTVLYTPSFLSLKMFEMEEMTKF